MPVGADVISRFGSPNAVTQLQASSRVVRHLLPARNIRIMPRTPSKSYLYHMVIKDSQMTTTSQKSAADDSEDCRKVKGYERRK